MGYHDATWHIDENGVPCGHDTDGRELSLTVVVKSGPPLTLTSEQRQAHDRKLVEAANVVDGLGLTKMQREIFAFMSDHIIRYPDQPWPSLTRIAHEVGCTHQNVSLVQRHLIDRGLLPEKPTPLPQQRAEVGSAGAGLLAVVGALLVSGLTVGLGHVAVTAVAMVAVAGWGIWELLDRPRIEIEYPQK